MLAWRLGLSAILIPSLIALFVLDHRQGDRAPILLGLCLVLSIRAAWEFTSLTRVRTLAPNFPLVACGSAAVVLASWSGLGASFGLETAALTFSFAVLACLLGGMLKFGKSDTNVETVATEILGTAYIGLLLAVTAQLRWVAGSQAGYLALGSLVIAAKLGDVGGYTLGRLFGKRKMAPRLSPGKTWMGALGAVLGAALGAWLWLRFAPSTFNPDWRPAPLIASLVYGALIGVVGLIGDLAESFIKRDVGKKDAAQLLPGFGGLLDLLDSILYAGPVALLLWRVLPLAPM